MKTSVYIALVLFFVSGLGGAAILLLKDNAQDRLRMSTLASRHVDINWGEGSQVSWDSERPAGHKADASRIQVARN